MSYIYKQIYKGNKLISSGLDRILHDEGYIKGTEWHYYLKDHLGNTRVDFVANSTSTNNVQDYHYYPFGMDFTGLNVGNSDNKYKHNGKELQGDHGLDWYDYGARFYDAAIGRFHTVDPLAEDYGFQSPQQFSEYPFKITRAVFDVQH